jgi:putative ABC transport system permease protein
MVRTLGFAFPRLFGSVGRLAVDNAERQPRRTAATASALMIGLALVSALTIFASSANASITSVIDRVLGADFLVSTQTQRPFPEQIATTVAEVPGVTTVSAVKLVPGEVNGEGTAIVGVDPTTLGSMLSLTFTSGSLE